MLSSRCDWQCQYTIADRGRKVMGYNNTQQLVYTRYGITDPNELIRTTRKNLGMDRSNFAQAMGVRANTVYYWETDQRKPPGPVVEWCLTVNSMLFAAEQQQKEQGLDWKPILIGFGLGALTAALIGALLDKNKK